MVQEGKQEISKGSEHYALCKETNVSLDRYGLATRITFFNQSTFKRAHVHRERGVWRGPP